MTNSPLKISALYRWYDPDLEKFSIYCQSAGDFPFQTLDSISMTRMAEDAGLFRKINRIANENGLIFRDAHSPWGESWDLNELTTPERIERQKNLLRQLAEAGTVKTYTIHQGAMWCYRNEYRGNEEKVRAITDHAVEQLLGTLEDTGIILAVENCFEPSTTARLAVDLLKRFDHPQLGLCLDVGHANLMEPRERDISRMVDYIRAAWQPEQPSFTPGIPELMAPDLVTVHLHDNDGYNDLHRAPGNSGTVDWQRYVSVIKSAPRLISIQSEIEYKDRFPLKETLALQELFA